MNRSIKKIIVAHVGARDKYSIAEMFQKRGLLLQLITDYWLQHESNVPNFIKRKFVRRYNKEIPNNKVISFRWVMLFWDLIMLKFQKTNFQKWIFHDRWYSKFALRYIKTRKPDMIWGYSNCSFEIFKYFKNDKSIIKVLNQIDPGIEYYEIKKNLWENFPTYEPKPEMPSEDFIDRMKGEWELADIIVVNSEYSKKCLLKYNVEPSKITVVPLIYNKEIVKSRKKYDKQRLLIGFVGNINLIKGFKNFIDVANRLSDKCDFIAIGEIAINESIINNTNYFIRYTGRLPYIEVEKKFKEMDILLFPSYCDGFGMVQLEEMANCVVVMSSEMCGDVVQNDINGFKIINCEDAISKIEILNNNRLLLSKMSNNCYDRVSDFYKENVEEKIEENLKEFGINFSN